MRCGIANRKLFAGPTPLADHGRVGETPVTATGSSVPRRDPTPCPEVGLLQDFVWRYRQSVLKNDLRDLRLATCEALLRDLQPPAESKAKKKKGKKKKQLPAGTVC